MVGQALLYILPAGYGAPLASIHARALAVSERGHLDLRVASDMAMIGAIPGLTTTVITDANMTIT